VFVSFAARPRWRLDPSASCQESTAGCWSHPVVSAEVLTCGAMAPMAACATVHVTRGGNGNGSKV
jgi:hypothetical protein